MIMGGLMLPKLTSGIFGVIIELIGAKSLNDVTNCTLHSFLSLFLFHHLIHLVGKERDEEQFAS